jgi:peptidoglycan/LPS O-acetylase OafA/YrhL
MIATSILQMGIVWLLGVAVWLYSQSESRMRLANDWRWKTASGALFCASLVSSKVLSFIVADYLVGIAFALLAPSLLGPWARPGWHRHLSTWLADISYTLYVVHFPVLFLIAAALLNGRQYDPDMVGCGYCLGLSVIAWLVACIMWVLFESNTDRIRRALPVP